MERHSLSLRPIALVHVFISVGSRQSQASYHPRRILSPCLPLMPRDSNNPTCTRLHSHINSHTHLLKNSPQHTHSYITHTHSHSCAHSCNSHSHTWAQTGVRTHSYTQWHAYSCTCTLTHLNTHLHTHFLMHAHINATHPPSYSYTITYTHSLTCILAHICKHILEHTRRHPGFFPRRGSEMFGIFQQKIVEHACRSESGQLETE